MGRIYVRMGVGKGLTGSGNCVMSFESGIVPED